MMVGVEEDPPQGALSCCGECVDDSYGSIQPMRSPPPYNIQRSTKCASSVTDILSESNFEFVYDFQSYFKMKMLAIILKID